MEQYNGEAAWLCKRLVGYKVEDLMSLSTAEYDMLMKVEQNSVEREQAAIEERNSKNK